MESAKIEVKWKAGFRYPIDCRGGGKVKSPPHTDEEWAAIRLSAIQLQEASNVIQIPGRQVRKPGERIPEGLDRQPEEIEALIDGDRQTFISLTHGLYDGAALALKATDARDIEELQESGEKIDKACERCPQQYRYLHAALPSNRRHPRNADSPAARETFYAHKRHGSISNLLFLEDASFWSDLHSWAFCVFHALFAERHRYQIDRSGDESLPEFLFIRLRRVEESQSDST